MKISSFIERGSNQIKYGVVRHGRIFTPVKYFAKKYPTVRDVIEARIIDELDNVCKEFESDSYRINDVSLLPPIPNARRVICVGMNYKKEYPVDAPAPIPDNIVLFSKLEGTLVGHDRYLEMPPGEAAKTYDYEGEIVCVIGKAGRFIKAENALEHIEGFTILNDGSVRGWQKQSIHAGKNFANSGSCGPWMVTRNEFEDINSMHIQTRLNGITVQDATANEMLFPIHELIAYISNAIDLKPGDLISTGSPDGSGGSRNPKQFLQVGDQLEIEVSGIGMLRNKVCSLEYPNLINSG
ncbi:MAG: fumarylacetoacetate hydrolase family protein [Gammaproteobacteria bacterium]|nr:fumarylacetoacetate hydrolase family protein [Gammaproteobacteria bacterium]